jgi:DNA helicase-2/ATP-dependent DNA helicase PcrA
VSDATASGALLDGLDDEQRVAAEALLGPVCVLAGAGTGKTRVITHRIAYGVATGVYAPNRVMALTFTSRAASELRTRLRALGTAGVEARTFHAAALAQLGHFWPTVIGGPLPDVLSGKARVLGQAAERLRMRVDTPTLRDVAAHIEWRKVAERGIEDYAAALDSGVRKPPGSLTVEQAVELHGVYESIKDERRQLDFEDVLLACVGMIESEPAVALHVREQYRFFVVDEYQDVSPLQQHLLETWLGGRDDVCVVGDASQTIYSFAGASSAFLLDFPRRRRDAVVVRLEQNYRSSGAIVETANRLMRGRPGALTLRARRDESGPQGASPDDRKREKPRRDRHGTVDAHGARPDITGFATDAEEAAAVAAEVRAAIDAGAPPHSFAVLYRMNAQSAPLEAALADAGVPYRVRDARRFFDQPVVRQAVMMLRAASLAVTADEPLFRSVSDVLRSLGWTLEPPASGGSVRDRWDSLNALMGLVDDVPAGTTFVEFTQELLRRQAAQHEPAVAAVTLCTLHSAKGLEWEDVHLVGLGEGLLPIGYARTDDEIEEERRLLYVGITRARHRLALSWAAQAAGPRERSRFLAELDSRTADAERAAAR